jgi:hypothetical protein
MILIHPDLRPNFPFAACCQPLIALFVGIEIRSSSLKR